MRSLWHRRVEQQSVREHGCRDLKLNDREYTMRAITLSAYLLAAGLFAATFAGSSASTQCLASKHGNVDFCEPNNTYIGNTRSFGSRAW